MDRTITPEDIVRSLEQVRVRRLRASDQPRLAERRMFANQPGVLRAKLKLWNDASLGSLMGDAAKDLKRRRKAVAIAAAAWRDLIPRNFVAPTELVGFNRGVLTVCVPDHACKFALDRILRAGGLSHFIRSVPLAVRDVRIVVGQVSEPISPVESRPPGVEDLERERLDELESGVAASRSDENVELRKLWRAHSARRS